jgi:hypothetical protein
VGWKGATLFGLLAAGCFTGVDFGGGQPPPARPTTTRGSGNTVSAVAPATVDVGGGEVITITGTNFEGGSPNARVSLGNKQCLNVNVASTVQIRCVTPLFDAEGTVDVMVVNGGVSAGSSGSCAGCLTAKDVRGPRVIEVFPPQHAAVKPGVSAKARFSEDVDPRTIDASSFHITGVAGDVFCNFACDAPCAGASAVRDVCFKPSQPLQAHATFFGVATGAITDLKGNALQGVDSRGELKWSFITCAEEEPCAE